MGIIKVLQNRMNMIIYLLNSTNDDNIQNYLLEQYAITYDKYMSIWKGGENNVKTTSSTMDWI